MQGGLVSGRDERVDHRQAQAAARPQDPADFADGTLEVVDV
jgi:hypothetical protein